MKTEELKEIGKFQRTHALKGELNALLDIDSEYVADDNPLVVDIDGCFVPFYAESIRTKGATSYLIKLDGIDTAEEASRFVNKLIYAPGDILADYEDFDEEGVYLSDMKGFDVWVEGLGYIGKVDYVDDSTANPLLFVTTPQEEEVIIPAADDFFTEIDAENKKVELSLPPGILDINKD